MSFLHVWIATILTLDVIGKLITLGKGTTPEPKPLSIIAAEVFVNGATLAALIALMLR